MNILLTSVGTATSVNMIKMIRSSRLLSDVRIIGTDINPIGMTAGSLLVDRFEQVPLGVNNDYLGAILEIVEQENIDALIPINDVEIEVISNNCRIFPSSCAMLLPSSEVIDLVKDKYEMTLFAQEKGILCPPIVGVDYMGKRVLRAKRGVGSKGFSIISAPHNCEDVIDELNSGQAFLQECIDGTEYTVDVLSDRNGKPLSIVPRARLEVKAGVATKALIQNDDVLIRNSRLLAQELKIPGFSNIQFICDAKNNYYFIEVNPRFGGFSIASTLAAPFLFDAFLSMLVFNDVDYYSMINNDEIKWGSIVTRYYSEVLYER